MLDPSRIRIGPFSTLLKQPIVLFISIALAVNFSTGLVADKYPANFIFRLIGVSTTVVTPYSAEPYYVLFILFSLACIPALALYGKLPGRMSRQQLIIDAIAFAFLAVWLYGLVLGIAMGNDSRLVIRNFAGMAMYSVYFLFVLLRISASQIFSAVYWAGLFVTVLTLILAGAADLANADIHSDWFALIAGPIMEGGATGLRRIFFTNQMVIFAVIAVTLYRIAHALHRRLFPRILDSLVCVLALVAGVLVPAARGNVLALIVLVVLLILVFAMPTIRRGRFSVGLAALVSASLIGFAMLLAIGYADLIFLMFSKKDVGNILRYEQFWALLDECTWIGKGLGAGLESGYARSDRAYGFEIIYVNIFHKFGIAAILLIAGYVCTLYYACAALYRNASPYDYASCALGSMAFTTVALGNPMLFSPVCVLLHCAALYLLREQKQPKALQETSPA